MNSGTFLISCSVPLRQTDRQSIQEPVSKPQTQPLHPSRTSRHFAGALLPSIGILLFTVKIATLAL